MQQVVQTESHFPGAPACDSSSQEQYAHPAHYESGHTPSWYSPPPPFTPPSYSSHSQTTHSFTSDASSLAPPAFPEPELPTDQAQTSGLSGKKHKKKKDKAKGPAASPQHHLIYLGVQIPDPLAPRVSLGVQKVKGYLPKEHFKTFMHYTRPEVIANEDMVVKLVDLFMILDVKHMDALDDYCVAKTGKNLAEHIETLSVNSDWKFAFKALALGPVGFDVELARKALAGFGTNEMLLIELILGRQAAEIKLLKAAYKARYGKDLADDVKNDISGKSERLFLMALNAQKPANDSNGTVDEKKVAQDVEALHHASKKKDEAAFCEILVNRSDVHLSAVITAYSEKHDKTLSKVVKKTFSGTMHQAMLYIIQGVKPKRDKQGIWRDAKLLEKSMAGFGTRTTQLTYRLIRAYWNVERLESIKFSYQWRYHKYLDHRVKGETSGIYRALLFRILMSTDGRRAKKNE
ncbi:hypothetical protein BJ165DRAFT_1398516 [Panaeolus papilionaceus]|nr:hypothetical protein BJ165DRAFT_1398516 [Panaeolus papilionaceus]